MRLVVCSIHDAKVGAFATPFFCRSKGEALRSFEDACNDDKLPFMKHPADYRLWIVGEFDDHDGALIPVEPMLLVGADELVIRPQVS